MRCERVTAFLIVALAAIPALAQGQAAPAPKMPAVSARDGQAVDLPAVVARMQQAQATSGQATRAYVLERDYRLYTEGEQQPKSDVVVQITFIPPNRKTFTIQKATGSARGENIVRKVLEHEVKAAANGKNTFLKAESYDFSYEGMATLDGHSCFVLGLHPKQRHDDLVVGRALVDRETYLPRLIDGDLAKNPSWFLKKVHVTLSFDNVGGMWLQTGTKAVADVRIFGEHIFTSRNIDYRTSESVATAASAPPRQRSIRRAQDFAGAAVLAH